MKLEEQQEPFPVFQRAPGQGIQEAHDIIERAKAEHPPEATILLYSGGNDSTVLLDVVREHVDLILHVNTGFGIPATNSFARDVMQASGIAWREASPPVPYEELVLTHPVLKGMPGPGVHGIVYQRLKERALRAILRELRTKRGQRFMLLTGVRRAESARRMGYSTPVDRKGGQVWVNPLLHWTNREMSDYRDCHGCPMSEVAANLHMSGECLCGAMADQGPERGERQQLRFFYPEFEARISALEEKCRRRGLPYTEWGIKRPNWRTDAAGAMCSSCEGRQLTLTERPS